MATEVWHTTHDSLIYRKPTQLGTDGVHKVYPGGGVHISNNDLVVVDTTLAVGIPGTAVLPGGPISNLTWHFDYATNATEGFILVELLLGAAVVHSWEIPYGAASLANVIQGHCDQPVDGFRSTIVQGTGGTNVFGKMAQGRVRQGEKIGIPI
jgi:hypothetical protein